MTSTRDRHSVAGARFFLAFVSALILMMATDAKAVNMDVVPSIRLEEGWDSNAFNSSDERGVLLRHPLDAGARPEVHIPG